MRLKLSTILLFVCGLLAPLEATASVEFPFQFHDGLLWINVSVAKAEKPLHFLLDSGAEVSTIDRRVLQSLGIKFGPRVVVSGVQSTETGYWPQRVKANVAGEALPRRMLAVDLTALSDVCSEPVDGLIGADFFRDRIVQIDFRAQVIRLLTPAEAKEVSGESLALDFRSCGMRVPVSINDHDAQWLRLDTGCVAALHWVANSVDPTQCRPLLAIGLAKVSLSTTRVSARLGSEKFQNITADLHQKEIFAGEAGLLGNGLLARFSRVTVNAKSGRLILTK